MELEKIRRVREISEISKDNTREVRQEYVDEVMESIKKTEEQLKSGKRIPMTLDDLDKMMGV